MPRDPDRYSSSDHDIDDRITRDFEREPASRLTDAESWRPSDVSIQVAADAADAADAEAARRGISTSDLVEEMLDRAEVGQ